MNPPKTEKALTLAAAADLQRAETDAFRLRRGELRAKELEVNGELRELVVVAAQCMSDEMKKDGATPEQKTGLAKALADLVKSHTTMQGSTFRIADMDTAVDIPKPAALKPPAPPTQIYAPGATINATTPVT